MATRPIPSPVIPATRTVREDAPSPTWANVSASVAAGQDEVILESEGLPAVAVISLAEYAALRKAREQEQRAEVARRFDALSRAQAERNSDLSETDVEEIAQRLSRELREERFLDAQDQLSAKHSSDKRT